MTAPLPPWPRTPPTHEGILLREFRDTDLARPLELLAAPYVALVSSLPAQATEEQARERIAARARDTSSRPASADEASRPPP